MVRSDAESLVASEEVPSRHSVVSALEPMFRPVRVAPYVAVHMALLVSAGQGRLSGSEQATAWALLTAGRHGVEGTGG